MEIILLKNHNGKKAGEPMTVTPEMAKYMVMVKVAEYSDNQPSQVQKVVTAKSPSKPKSVKKPKDPNAPKAVRKPRTQQLKPKLETK